MAQKTLYGKRMSEKTYICLNGGMVEAAQAVLPVADRGFRFGDGVFTTVRLLHREPYQWALHVARLEAGCKALRIEMPAVDWLAHARAVIEANAVYDGFLRIAISRGVGSQGYLPKVDIAANWVMEYLPPLPLPASPLKLWLSAIERPSVKALPVNQKLAHGVGSTLALLEAHDHQCDEALMLGARQQVCEASSANLFWVMGGKLFTPSLETGCLAGTTRAAVMRLASVEEVAVELSVLEKAEAVFATNARLGVWPVASIAPMGWSYDAKHPLVEEISAKLLKDYQA